MTSDFEQFLRALPAGLFDSDGPLPVVEVTRALGVPEDILPESYRAFVAIIGPGWWKNLSGAVVAPAALYAFDADCWEMEGFVALVENVAQVGDYLAVNPADPVTDGERPLYYCGHDPFSCARAADSFEAWVRESAASRLSASRRYAYLHDLRSESHRRYEAWERALGSDATSKRWWQFWK